MSMYQELLMDHYRHPRNQGTLENPDFSTGNYNPSCGDSIALQGIVKQGVVVNVVFVGKGCVISQATASILTQWAHHKTVQEIMACTADDLLGLLGIPLGPMRIKCALLSLGALQKGLESFIIKS